MQTHYVVEGLTSEASKLDVALLLRTELASRLARVLLRIEGSRKLLVANPAVVAAGNVVEGCNSYSSDAFRLERAICYVGLSFVTVLKYQD